MRRRCDDYRIQRAVFTQNVLLHLTKIDGCLVQCIALWWCDTLFLSSAGCRTWCTVYRGEIQHYSTTLAQTLNRAPYTTYTTTAVHTHITTNSLTTPPVQTNSFLCLQDSDNSTAVVRGKEATTLECEEDRQNLDYPSQNIVYFCKFTAIMEGAISWLL